MSSKAWSEKEIETLKLLRSKPNPRPYADCVKAFDGRTQDAIRFKMWSINNVDKIDTALEKERIAVFDIETTNFKANIGFMLSWAIYYPDTGETVWDVVKKSDITSLRRDKRICKSLLKELKDVDIVMGYNSTRFDIPFFRTRCIGNGLIDDFPQYGELRHIDCYYFARGKVATHRKSLDAISTFLGVGGKTPVDIGIWADAQLGSPEALKTVLEHNIIDVKVTWDVYNVLKRFGKYVPRSI